MMRRTRGRWKIDPEFYGGTLDAATARREFEEFMLARFGWKRPPRPTPPEDDTPVRWRRISSAGSRTGTIHPEFYGGTLDAATARREFEEFMEKRLGWKRFSRPVNKPAHPSCEDTSDTSNRSDQERPEQPSDETG